MKRKILFIIALGMVFSILLTTVLYPIIYKEYVYKYSKEYGLDPFLVLSVIKIESNFNENAISKKDARGLMQISHGTGKWAAETFNLENYSVNSLYKPEINIKIGTWYLNKLIEQFGDIELALAAYNAGSGNVQTWLKDINYSEDGKTLTQIPFKETKDYIYKVQKNTKIYRIIYWHPYFLKNENLFDNIFLKAREFIIKITRKLR